MPYYGVNQNLMPPAMRAAAAAILFFMINLLGWGIGTPLYGVAMDALTRHLFEAHALGDYVSLCGKGGAKLAAANITQACQASLAEGTRWTLMCGSAFGGLWAAAHFYLGSRTL